MSKIWLESEFENKIICGIDEAGRGPLAGPCVVCGVIMPINYSHPFINDSKQLSAKKRALCFKDILRDALWVNIVAVSPKVIDELNIYRATQKAMHTIASQSFADVVLTDAMPLEDLNKEHHSYIKGDSRSINIAAASIVAKEMRDHIMMMYDQKYPNYGFKQHKGYPTKAHLKALSQYGVLNIHRQSYGPVSKLNQISLFD